MTQITIDFNFLALAAFVVWISWVVFNIRNLHNSRNNPWDWDRELMKLAAVVLFIPAYILSVIILYGVIMYAFR